MATGVLVLGVGPATRLLRFLSGLPKSYEALIRFGSETDSLDADGRVTVTHDMAVPAPNAVRAAASTLTGELLQVPPMVSAKKVDGTRLHELARRGEVVERAPVPIAVHRFDVEPTADPMAYVAHVECSAGTYVRVLASDLGHALGGGAHLGALRRTAVGPFGLGEAVSLDELDAGALLAPSAICRILDHVEVDDAAATDIGHGKVLERGRLGLGDTAEGPWAVLDADGGLIAVYEAHRGTTVKPALVLS